MSKFAKITLLTLAAFLVLGFSIAANAAKPEFNQVLRSAPIPGLSGFSCAATNLSDSEIEINIVITSSTGFVETNEYVDVDAGLTEQERADGPGTFRCTINWTGNPNDFVASFCSYENAGAIQGIVCLELF
jgi:hypothetical protein